MTDKYTWTLNNDLHILQFFDNEDNIFNFSSRYQPPSSVLSDSFVDLMNQAYEEGLKASFEDLSKKYPIYNESFEMTELRRKLYESVDKEMKLQKENEKLKEELADWENGGTRITYNPTETRRMIDNLARENSKLRAENEKFKKTNEALEAIGWQMVRKFD